MTKPKIIISKCLEFSACRYDGGFISNQYIKKMKNSIDFIPVCPEVEIGLGTPRDPVKIIDNDNRRILYQESTKKDLSKKMNSFSTDFLKKNKDIDGFILKSKSPSCAINSTKIFFNKTDINHKSRNNGFFTEHILLKFSNHPKVEEENLNNSSLRNRFFTSIFTLADFRKVTHTDDLYNFHEKHKYLFMSYDQILMKKMGDIAANKNNCSLEDIISKYYNSLLKLFVKKPCIKTNINTHKHIMGHLKKLINSNEKKYFSDILKQYKAERISLSKVNNTLFSWVIKFKDDYLEKQSFFNPFPKELRY